MRAQAFRRELESVAFHHDDVRWERPFEFPAPPAFLLGDLRALCGREMEGQGGGQAVAAGHVGGQLRHKGSPLRLMGRK
jgi:hypothetical protein